MKSANSVLFLLLPSCMVMEIVTDCIHGNQKGSSIDMREREIMRKSSKLNIFYCTLEFRNYYLRCVQAGPDIRLYISNGVTMNN